MENVSTFHITSLLHALFWQDFLMSIKVAFLKYKNTNQLKNIAFYCDFRHISAVINDISTKTHTPPPARTHTHDLEAIIVAQGSTERWTGSAEVDNPITPPYCDKKINTNKRCQPDIKNKWRSWLPTVRTWRQPAYQLITAAVVKILSSAQKGFSAVSHCAVGQQGSVKNNNNILHCID